MDSYYKKNCFFVILKFICCFVGFFFKKNLNMMLFIGFEIYLEIFDIKFVIIEVLLFIYRVVGGNFLFILVGFVRCLKNINY